MIGDSASVIRHPVTKENNPAAGFSLRGDGSQVQTNHRNSRVVVSPMKPSHACSSLMLLAMAFTR